MRVMDSQFDRDEAYALIVSTCGFERRSSYVCRIGPEAREKVAIEFPGSGGASFESNKVEYRRAGWEFDGIRGATARIRRAAGDRSDEAVRIAVDISSMPRAAIAAIVETLFELGSALHATFLYVPGAFESSAEAAGRPESLAAAPVSPFFAGALRPPSIPIGLVLGLGLEPHRALGVIELLEPARTWAFTGRGGDRRFEVALAEINGALSGVVEPSRILEYDVRSVAETYGAVESLVFSAGLDYRLILAPSGPKVFTLACLLVGAARDVHRPAVWRVGSARPAIAVDVHEAGDVVAASVMF